MGTNMILVMGALVTFGILLVSSNRMMTSNTRIAEQNEYYITALSLGQSVLDEAKDKYFDAKSDSTPVVVADSLSPTLGPEAGESIPNPDTITTAFPFSAAAPGFRSQPVYNDVDDYNGYNRVVNTPRAEGYNIRVKVIYASPSNPDSASAKQTFCKVLFVTVTNWKYLAQVEYKPGEAGYQAGKGNWHPDTVKIAYAFTY